MALLSQNGYIVIVVPLMVRWPRHARVHWVPAPDVLVIPVWCDGRALGWPCSAQTGGCPCGAGLENGRGRPRSDHGNGEALHRNILFTPPSRALGGAGNEILWTRSRNRTQIVPRREEGKGGVYAVSNQVLLDIENE